MFGNRKLRIELSNALHNNEDLQYVVKGLREQLSRHEAMSGNLNLELGAVKRNYTNCQKELEGIKSKVRAQNEADLMFVSVKMIVELLKGKKLKDKDHVVDLLGQNQAMYYERMQQGNSLGVVGDIFRDLGLIR